MSNLEDLTGLVEAILFAAGNAVSKKDILDKVEELTDAELDYIVSELKDKYNKTQSGIILLTFNDKLQLSTNSKFGERVSLVLTPIKEKELTKSLMEVLSVIAYNQPITRAEIEECRNGSNPDYAVGMLSKLNLITVVGRKDAIGRPMLYGTTDDFLKRFELNSLADLPDKKQLAERIQLIDTDKMRGNGLFRDHELSEEFPEEVLEESQQLALGDLRKQEEEEYEIPDFLEGEEFNIVETNE